MQDSATRDGIPWTGAAALVAAGVLVTSLLAGVSAADVLRTWPLARASGLVAYVLLWASVCLGLLPPAGATRPAAAAARMDLHCFVSAWALYSTTFHALVLLWDRHVRFTWTDVLVPFASAYRPILVGLGGLAFYLALGATVTTYLRGLLSPGLWRAIHQLTLAAYLLALWHGVLLGSDTHLPLVKLLYAGTAAAAGALAFLRLAAPEHPAARDG